MRGMKEWEAVEMYVHAAKSTAEPQSLGVIKRQALHGGYRLL